MSSRKFAAKLYSMIMFVVVSVLCGLLAAGLGVPAAAVVSATVKGGANSLEALPTDLTVPPQIEGSKMYLSDGTLLASFYNQNRQYVSLNQIAAVMQKAQVAIEDHRFFDHGALDLQGLLRAAAGNVIGGDVTGGGSTLTQQYVKQVRIQIAQQNNDAAGVAAAQAPTMTRKISEMRYAVALEKSLNQRSPGKAKEIILERYLNIAYYGDGAYGVQAAAQHYFGVNAKDLNLPQAAMLAGLVQSPGTTDPVHHHDEAIARRNVVLDAMARWDSQDPGWFPNSTAPAVTQAEADAAKATGFDASKVATAPQGCEASQWPFICAYALNVLLSDQMPALGASAEDRQRALDQSALNITLTVNPQSQQDAQDAINRQISPTDPVVSVADIVNPKNGQILAMAQNKKWGDGSNNTTQYIYSVTHDMGGAEGYTAGSTFKTFTAAAAINQGANPHTLYYDAQRVINYRGQTFKNCSGSFVFNEDYPVTNSVPGVNGYMNMVRAMQWSVDNYYVILERDAGICQVTQMAQAAGIQISLPSDKFKTLEDYQNNPSFTLGGANIAPLSLASAYGTFGNRGIHCNPIILASVKTRDGREMPVPQADCKQVIDPNVAAGVNMVLKAVMDSGLSSGQRISGGYDQASKTGTAGSSKTESAVWFAGYTPEVSGVAMVAVDQNNPYWQGKLQTLTGLRLTNGKYFAASSTTDTGVMWNNMIWPELNKVPPTKFAPFNPPSGPNPSIFKTIAPPPPPKPVAPSAAPDHGTNNDHDAKPSNKPS